MTSESETIKIEIVNQVIWETVMEGTGACGWTDRAREGLVNAVQEAVEWALSEEGQAMNEKLLAKRLK